MFMTGIAFVGKRQLGQVQRVVQGGAGLPGQISEFAPGIEASAIDDIGVGVGDQVDAA